MTGSQPLDLNQIDPAIWRVLVDGVVYGPYTLGQLRAFAKEGRLTPTSKIAEGDGAAFIEAVTCQKLSSAFAGNSGESPTLTLKNFVIIAHLVEDRNAVVATLNQLGSFGEALPGIFLLKSSHKLAVIQSEIRNAAQSHEQVLIVDASSNRLGWLGLDFDTDAHVRTLWSKPA